MRSRLLEHGGGEQVLADGLVRRPGEAGVLAGFPVITHRAHRRAVAAGDVHIRPELARSSDHSGTAGSRG